MKIAVHLHLYYQYMIDEMLFYLRNFGDIKYDLFVTTVNDNDEIKNKILSFKSDSHIYILENKGYDIGPFIYFLHQINLDDYDLIWKLQTKRNLPRFPIITRIGNLYIYGKMWRKILFDAILASNKQVNEVLNRFTKDSKLGMIGTYELSINSNSLKNNYHAKKSSTYAIEKLRVIYNNQTICEQNKYSITGSMFVIRSKILKKIKQNFNFNDFKNTDEYVSHLKGNKNNTTLPHVLERMLCYIVYCENCYIGYNYISKSSYTLMTVRNRFLRILRFFLQIKINTSKIVIKILKIPVFYCRFKKYKKD